VKFLLDHDVPDDLSYLLEELKHEVTLLRTTFSILQRRARITASSLLYAAEPERTNALRYFGSWNVLVKLVS